MCGLLMRVQKGRPSRTKPKRPVRTECAPGVCLAALGDYFTSDVNEVTAKPVPG